MFDTYVTVVGNVLTAPNWRRTANTNSLVANFKVASTARRMDRENRRWVDGNSLRVRVNCWRKLAEGVASSVTVGDPVVVVGRLYTRDWTDSEGNRRTLYELDALAVGHDLARGRGRFARNKPTLATSEVADREAEHRVNGEPTVPVPDGEIVVRRVEFVEDGDPILANLPPAPGTDELAQLRGGFGPTEELPDDPADDPEPDDDDLLGDPLGEPAAELGDDADVPVGGIGDGMATVGEAGDARAADGRAADARAADGDSADGDTADDQAGDDPADDPADDPRRQRGRPRRGRSRETVSV